MSRTARGARGAPAGGAARKTSRHRSHDHDTRSAPSRPPTAELPSHRGTTGRPSRATVDPRAPSVGSSRVSAVRIPMARRYEPVDPLAPRFARTRTPSAVPWSDPGSGPRPCSARRQRRGSKWITRSDVASDAGFGRPTQIRRGTGRAPRERGGRPRATHRASRRGPAQPVARRKRVGAHRRRPRDATRRCAQDLSRGGVDRRRSVVRHRRRRIAWRGSSASRPPGSRPRAGAARLHPASPSRAWPAASDNCGCRAPPAIGSATIGHPRVCAQ